MELNFESGSMNWDQLEKNLGAETQSSKKKNYKDDRFWTLSKDENDMGGALIRLLPDPEATPYISRYSHGFQSFDNDKKKKRWYLNVSPQTIEEECPASDLWSEFYNLGTEEAKLEAKTFGRKIKFMTNIKVIKDPANPQNEGKIFLWEFGPKLKDKFMQALNPSEADIQMGEEPKQLFNPLAGCNIKLKIKKAAGFFNYDDTTIEVPSSIYEDGASAKEDIINNAHKLNQFLQPEAFETYDELKGKLKWVTECLKPNHMDEVVFRDVINKFLNKNISTNSKSNGNDEQSEVSETQNIETTIQEPAQESTNEAFENKTVEPVKKTEQTSQPNQSQTSSGDDLSFLDDL